MKTHYKGKYAPADFDPSWIVKLAEEQQADDELLIENLRKCTTVIGFCSCGCGDPYFVDPESPEWRYGESVILFRDDGTEIIVDVLLDNRIGGIEIGEWDKKK